jgi:hypothetical protein
MLSWWGFGKRRSQEALAFASTRERTITPNNNKQVVLVSVGQLSQLRRAYPNYFMDIQYFVDVLSDVMEGKILEDKFIDLIEP